MSWVYYKIMNEDKILQKLVEHDERLDRIEQSMATKADIRDLHTVMDRALNILDRLDQERLFTVEWVKRIENDVEKIKKHLHLA